MKKIKVILTAALIVSSVALLAACGGDKVKPTFMYFYTNAENETVNPIIEELQDEYGKKVTFSLVNIDENPEALNNFELVKGNTPALIMLNTDNDISKFEFQCADKETLKADIEDALK